MTTANSNVNSGTRLASMFLDHFFMTMICMLFYIPMMIKNFAGAFNVDHEQQQIDIFSGPWFYVALFGFALYFCKDCINGRSIAKRILKHQVVNNKTGQVASPLRCFVRDLFCIFWPIEGIVALISPARRIGDLVAGTKIVTYDSVAIPQPAFNVLKIIPPIIISYALFCLAILPLKSIMPVYPKINYVESSYNPTESRALEKLLSDSLGEHLTPSFKVYDKISNQPGKYISVIYKLKYNYLEEDNSSDEIHKQATDYLYSMFPGNSFTGQAKYVFKSGNSFKMNIREIGVSNRQPLN